MPSRGTKKYTKFLSVLLFASLKRNFRCKSSHSLNFGWSSRLYHICQSVSEYGIKAAAARIPPA